MLNNSVFLAEKKMQPKMGLGHYYIFTKLIIKIKSVTFCEYEKTGILTYYSVNANWLDK